MSCAAKVSRVSSQTLAGWQVQVPADRAAQVAPVQIEVSTQAPGSIADADADVIVLPVLADDGAALLGPGADEVGSETGIDLIEVLEAAGHSGRVGEFLRVPAADRQIALPAQVPVGRRMFAVLLRSWRGS